MQIEFDACKDRTNQDKHAGVLLAQAHDLEWDTLHTSQTSGTTMASSTWQVLH